MASVERPRSESDLEEDARLRLERAENSDDATRLETLDEMYETLEAELDEDPPSRP